MPADYAWCTITEADEMETNMEKGRMKFVARENVRNPERNLPSLRSDHHETHMEWQGLRTPDPIGGRREFNRLHHGTVSLHLRFQIMLGEEYNLCSLALYDFLQSVI